MTLELKQYPGFGSCKVPYLLGGVREITDKTEYGEGHHAITIFDRRVFLTDGYEYIRDVDTNKYFVKDGKWVGE
jgi:hypothetical protein